MTTQELAIELNCSPDYEYIITATSRITGKIMATATNYNCDVAVLRVDIQLIEAGYELYTPEFY